MYRYIVLIVVKNSVANRTQFVRAHFRLRSADDDKQTGTGARSRDTIGDALTATHTTQSSQPRATFRRVENPLGFVCA